MSRLGDAISPYLRSHANQPVDWFPWGPEAFQEAVARDVPLLISIGYHTCHWCHVMSRECFSDPTIAELINANLVAVKVDREEYPEVDEVYMAQASAFVENLGWPLTVFATPEGHVFYAATYLPPTARNGLPSLPQVIDAVSKAWAEKRDEVTESSRSLVEALQEAHRAGERASTGAFPDQAQLAAVVDALSSREDTEYGGFGGAPKFPVAPVLRFVQGQADFGNKKAEALCLRVLDAYQASLLRDPVEGGFFRYATRRDFSEPHYERMLYDNAGLLALYANAGMADTAAGIVNFFRRQLLVDGALGSAQDSESVIDGSRNEGGYYLLDEAARARVDPPEVDSKIVTGWNGLALDALAKAHRAGVPGDPGLLGVDIARWLCDNHITANGLIRVSEGGRHSSAPATAEDYGGLALGLVELALATGTAEFVKTARSLIDTVISEGANTTHDPLLKTRGLEAGGSVSEGASPSGQALLALAALRLSLLTGQESYRDFAKEQVAPHVAEAMLNPLGYGGILQVLAEVASPRREVLVIADGASELVGTVQKWRANGAISVAVNSEQALAFVEAGCAVFEGRTDGSTPIAYVCEAGVCRLPVHSAEELRLLLAQ